MSRSSVTLRSATPADAEALVTLWSDVIRRGDHSDQLVDMQRIIETASADPRQSLVVAVYDGTLAGAALLRVTELTPINLEPVCQIVSPHVLDEFRHRGVGHALMEAAVSFADCHGVDHIGAAASATDREANRFLARLSLGAFATLRLAPTSQVRARLGTSRVASAPSLKIERVLAARRRRQLAAN